LGRWHEADAAGGLTCTLVQVGMNPCIFAHQGAARTFRPSPLSRGNWTFLGSDNGGHTAAILFSFIATCNRHGINVFDYLRDVLARIAAHPKNHLAELLPDRWQPTPTNTI